MGADTKGSVSISSTPGALPARRLALPVFLATLGTFFEWYDFFVAALAATLAWPAVFFPTYSPVAALAASVSAYAATFFARPIAAFMFGHVGDRIGRRITLFATMATMSVAMFGIAFTPPYASIGFAAPALIAIFRFIMGFGLGGEFQGAISFVSELVPGRRRRAAVTSLPQLMALAGQSVGAFVFLAVLPLAHAAAYSYWWWRIPFMIGGMVVVVGAIMQYRVLESPLFSALRARGGIARWPSFGIFRKYWREIVLLTFIGTFFVAVGNITLMPLGIPYLAAHGIVPPRNMIVVGIATAVDIPIALLFALWTDASRYSKWPMLTVLIGGIALTYPFFLAVNTGSFLYALIAAIIYSAFFFSGNGVAPYFMARSFPTEFRVSGIGLSYQIGAIYTGLFLTLAPSYIYKISHGVANSWPYMGAAAIAFLIAGLVAFLLLLRITKRPSELDAAHVGAPGAGPAGNTN